MSNSLSNIDPSSDMGRRMQAEQFMSTDLKKISDEIAEKLGGMTQVELRSNWEIALKLYEVHSDTEKYMEDGCDRLAMAHGIDGGRLKAYLNVAEYVDESLIKKAEKYNSGVKSRYGRITYSHFCAIARLGDSGLQSEVFGTIVSDGLSVEQTRQLVSDKIQHMDAESEEGASRSVKVRPASILTQSTKVSSKIGEVMSPIDVEEFNMTVLQTFNHGTEKQCDKLRALLSSTIDSLQIMVETANTRIERLQELTQEVEESYRKRLAKEAGIETSDEEGDLGDDEAFEEVDEESDLEAYVDEE